MRTHARKLRLKSKNPRIDTEALSPYGTECFFYASKAGEGGFPEKVFHKVQNSGQQKCRKNAGIMPKNQENGAKSRRKANKKMQFGKIRPGNYRKITKVHQKRVDKVPGGYNCITTEGSRRRATRLKTKLFMEENKNEEDFCSCSGCSYDSWHDNCCLRCS
ncbi:MAG: hypothetical protein V8Q30_01275 [Acutalibacteraceae bacterium]